VCAKVVGATSSEGFLVSADTATLIVCLLCRAASDLIEELLDDKRYNSRARPQADTSMLSTCQRYSFHLTTGEGQIEVDFDRPEIRHLHCGIPHILDGIRRLISDIWQFRHRS